MGRRRLLICLLMLGIAVTLVEWHSHRELTRFENAGGVTPPFGEDRSPENLAKLRKVIRRLTVGGDHQVKGRFDARYGWTNAPGRYKEGPVEFVINSIGARGATEFGPLAPAESKRVLCLGDSFTYGTEVSDSEDWPSLINNNAEELEVINLGVGGWSIGQSYLRFLDVSPELAPDVVLVGFFIGAVGRNVNRFRPFLYPSDLNPMVKPRFRLVDDALVLTPQPYASRLEMLRALEAGTLLETMSTHDFWADDSGGTSWSNLSRLLASRRAEWRRLTETQLQNEDEEPFRVMVALLDAFVGSIRESGAESCVLLFPRKHDWHMNLQDGWERHAPWRGLRAALEERELPYLDLYEVLGAYPIEEVYGQVHLSPQGNAVVARAVRTWLDGARDG